MKSLFAVLFLSGVITQASPGLKTNLKDIKLMWTQSFVLDGCSINLPQNCVSTSGVSVNPVVADYVQKNSKELSPILAEMRRLDLAHNKAIFELNRTGDSEKYLKESHKIQEDHSSKIKPYSSLIPQFYYSAIAFESEFYKYPDFVMSKNSLFDCNDARKFCVVEDEKKQLHLRTFVQFKGNAGNDYKPQLMVAEDIAMSCTILDNSLSIVGIKIHDSQKIQCQLAENRGQLNFIVGK